MDTITFLILVAVILCIISLIHKYKIEEYKDKSLKEYMKNSINVIVRGIIIFIIVGLLKYNGLKLALFIISSSMGFICLVCIIDIILYYSYNAISKKINK